MKNQKNYLTLLDKYSLIVVKNNRIVYKSKEKELHPLFKVAEKRLLEDSEIFDRVIGLAAAKICYWHKVKIVNTLTISKDALSYLVNNQVTVNYNQIVNEIVQLNNKACPMEKIARHSQNFAKLLEERNKLFNAKLEKASKDGVFPDYYYSTTNVATNVKINNQWINVQKIEMDVGIKVDIKNMVAECVTNTEVKKGDTIVVGESGIDVLYQERQEDDNDFKFMSNEISTERIKTQMTKLIANKMKVIKKNNGRILWVTGPAVIHTGGGEYLESIIRKGYIDCLFTGNGFASHDIERNMFGTSLGVCKKSGMQSLGGHHHHLWAINRVRNYGSIKEAVLKKAIKGGVMYELVKNNISFILGGSVRDDGPLPDTIRDNMKVQELLRSQIQKGFDMAIMCATTLHTVATGNLLPDTVSKVVVDANPSSLIKLIDRGTTGSLGVVTDVEFFLKEINNNL